MTATKFPQVGWMKESFQVLTLNDEIFEFDWIMQPGGKVPAHLHKESDEYFTVLEGEVTLKLGDETILAKPGKKLTVPKMIMHSVSNRSDRVFKCRVSYEPIADQGKFFQILFFLKEKNPDDRNALFKAMYIASEMNYKEFSTVQGGMKIAEHLMFGFFILIAPVAGWKALLQEYRLWPGG